MRRNAPGSIATIGTLNIVFGSLFSFCCLSVVVVQITGFGMGNDFEKGLLEEFLTREIPVYHVVKWGSTVLGTLCFLVMAISGVGLVSQSNWARVLAITNAWIMIPFFLGAGIYDLAVQAPAASRFFRANPMLNDMAGLLWMEIIVSVVIYLMLLVYAIITLSMLMSARVRDFFQQTSFNDAFYDDDWDDAPRSRGSRDYRDY